MFFNLHDVVQTSGKLVDWGDFPSDSLITHTTAPGGALTHTFTGIAPRLVRLKATPN